MTDSSIVELGDEFFQDPHKMYSALRRDGAVHHVRLPTGVVGWLVTDFHTVKHALADTSLSKDLGCPRGHAVIQTAGLTESGVFGANMLFSDPPRHTRLRRLVNHAFTERTVETLAPRITDIADELLAGLSGDNEVELLSRYCFPLPLAVICELLGVPIEDRAAFRQWSSALTGAVAPPDQIAAASREMFGYLENLIAARADARGAGLLSELLAADEDHDMLDREELVSMVFLLLVAGHETTVNLIGHAMLEYLCDSRVRRRLLHDPGSVPLFVEEVLRRHPPVHLGTVRYTKEPIRLGGRDIGAGEVVFASILAANNDPTTFVSPERVDVDRDGPRHVAFGHGIHHCVGARLARLEAHIALVKLLHRFPAMTLDVPVDTIARRHSTAVHGLQRLPVRLQPESGR